MSLSGLDHNIWKDFKFNPERINKMQAGSEIILNFLNIALSQGLLRSDLLSKENLTELSTRLIDTQIPTAARKVKVLIDLDLSPQNLQLYKCELRWLGHVATYLKKFAQLTLPAQLELWQVSGATINKDLVLQNPPIQDGWTIKNIEIMREDSLTTRKTWMLGHQSGVWVYTLDFAFGNQKLSDAYKKGNKIYGAAYPYPGLTLGRVILKELHLNPPPSINNSGTFKTVGELKKFIAQLYAQNIFLQEIPFTLSGFKALMNQEELILMDENSQYIKIADVANQKHFANKETHWELVANGNAQLNLFDLMYYKEQYFLVK